MTAYPATTHGHAFSLSAPSAPASPLAVGILQVLVLEKSVPGLFCDFRELLKAIGTSYNPQVAATELEVLNTGVAAEVLVIDEQGAAKPTFCLHIRRIRSQFEL